MSAPYLPVPDLIRQIEDRATFPAGASGQEIILLAEAAERLAARARQELSNRWTERLQAQRAPK
jgi:hypothetical protein